MDNQSLARMEEITGRMGDGSRKMGVDNLIQDWDSPIGVTERKSANDEASLVIYVLFLMELAIP